MTFETENRNFIGEKTRKYIWNTTPETFEAMNENVNFLVRCVNRTDLWIVVERFFFSIFVVFFTSSPIFMSSFFKHALRLMFLKYSWMSFCVSDNFCEQNLWNLWLFHSIFFLYFSSLLAIWCFIACAGLRRILSSS